MARKNSSNPEDFWRTIVNSLSTVPFPEVGSEPPLEETISDSPQVDPALIGNFSRVSMDIYFFLDPNTHKYFTFQNQYMIDYGKVTLGEAAEMVRKRKRKTKD